MSRLRVTSSSGALGVAVVALIVALGGTSYAAFTLPTNSVGAKQLKNKAVTPAKVAPMTIALFKGQKGDKGDAGPRGAQGIPGIQGRQGVEGIQGPVGPSYAYYSRVLSGYPSVSVPAGDYVVYGDASFLDTSPTADLVACQIYLNGSNIGGQVGLYSTDYATIPGDGNASVPDSAIVHLVTAGTVSNHCPVARSILEGNASVTAIKVGTVSP
jgi:hypothetical protein